MKAMVIREFGGPEVLRREELPDPKAGPVREALDAWSHRAGTDRAR